MKHANFQEDAARPRQPKIGDRINSIQFQANEIRSLINYLTSFVQIVSGEQVDATPELSPLSSQNIPSDLSIIENNLNQLSNSLRKCVETLENSL